MMSLTSNLSRVVTPRNCVGRVFSMLSVTTIATTSIGTPSLGRPALSYRRSFGTQQLRRETRVYFAVEPSFVTKRGFSTATSTTGVHCALEVLAPIERFADDAYSDFEAEKKIKEALKIVDDAPIQNDADKLVAAKVRTRIAEFESNFDRNTPARDPKSAEAQAQKALDLLKELPQPNDADASSSGSQELQDARMYAWLALGNAQVGLRKFEEAEDSFCAALKIAEASEDRSVRIATTLHCLAKNYETQGGVVYAEGLYTQALAFLDGVTDPPALKLLQQVQKDWTAFMRHLKRA